MTEYVIQLIGTIGRDFGRLAEVLAGKGYTVREAGRFSSMVHGQGVDLIITVAEQVAMSPGEAGDHVMGSGATPASPVLLLLNPESDAGIIRKYLDAGIEYFMVLPVGKKYFLSRIRSILDENKSSRGRNESVQLDIPTEAGGRTVRITGDRLQNALIAALENGLHHGRMLMKSHRKFIIPRDSIKSDPEISVRSREKKRVSDELILAIENSEFELFYQPIVDLKTGKLSGFEALMRRNNPELGYISPGEFIPLAEETGLILSLGFWAIESAGRQIAFWRDKFPLAGPLSVSINLSTVQFIHPGLAEQILDIVDRLEIEHEAVRFEITESALMSDMESANIMLLKLKAMRFKLYMDDFGTGYSSLSYLRHFPVDVLKIDQSFVKWMGIDEESGQIVKTIIDLAHNLGKTVIAEGIETPEHLEELLRLGCDYGQGFYFAKPLPVADATEMLDENKNFFRMES